VRTEVILIGLILSAVVMISRVAPMALLGQRELPVRLRRLIETLPGCAIAGFMTVWAMPGEDETLRSSFSVVAGALVALAICIPTGRLLLAMLAGLAVAAGLSLLV
jgi:branched-subunit amino acid transport protein